MRRRLVVFPIVLSALLLLPSVVAALGTLDQEQANHNNIPSVAGTVEHAQVFTSGLTGQLDQVDLYLTRSVGSTGPGADLTVEIWTVTAGAPASPVPGASATVLEASVPANTPMWVGVPISAPSVALTQYAIVVSAPGASGFSCPEECWIWWVDDGASYAGGLGYFSTDSGTTWAPKVNPEQDSAFRTFVTVPAPTPVASNLPNAAMGSSADTSPLLVVGLAVLLIGSLGMLAFAGMVVLVARKLGAFRPVDPSTASAPGATTGGAPPDHVPPA